MSNEGFLAVGVGSLLTVAAQYNQSPSGSFETFIGGLVPQTDYGVLTSIGEASLNGTLILALDDNFVPVPEQTFTVLTALTVQGQFAGYSLPPLPAGETWQVNYLAGSVELTVVPEPYGTSLIVVALMSMAMRTRPAGRPDAFCAARFQSKFRLSVVGRASPLMSDGPGIILWEIPVGVLQSAT